MRYKFKIQYDGTNFSGWQNQKDQRTVQGVIEQALGKILKKKSLASVYGAGRTDSGVHAWEQVAHVDLKTSLSCIKIKKALNAHLPIDCKIDQVELVKGTFHSRYDAKRRHYRYQCYIGSSILFRNQSWILPGLNVSYLNRLANSLVGENDFLSFSKFNKGKKNTKCIIYDSKWVDDGKMIIFKIEANRFLHHMIRYLVGTMIAVEKKQYKELDFIKLLEEPNKSAKVHKAPPQGLILERIDYA